MSTDLAGMNLLRYSAQVAVVVAAGALLAHLFFQRRDPRLLLWHWQIVLWSAIALPLALPWQPLGRGAVEISMGAPGAVLRDAPAYPAALPWATLALTVWGLGAGALLLRLAAGLFRLARYRAQSQLAEMFENRIEVRVSTRIDSPVTWGWRRPVILLPAGGGPPQAAVLAHEMAHVRRGDWMMTLAEECLRALLWFHPAVWFALDRVRSAREQVVDQEAIRATGSAHAYLESLLHSAGIDDCATSGNSSLATPFLRRRHLAERVRTILSEVPSMSLTKLRMLTALSAVVLGITALWAAQLTPLRAEAAQEAPQPAPGEGRLLHKVEPAYPPEARLAGIEGEVQMEIAISDRGLVTDARVLSGPEELRAAAVKAVLEWQFTPGRAAKATVVTTFRLSDKESKGEPPVPLGIVRVVDLSALSGAVKQRIAARLRVQPGEPFTADTWRAASDLAGSVDGGLRVTFDAASGVLRVVPGDRIGDRDEFPRVPQTVRLASDVQKVKLRRQTPPVYPAAAKAAGVQGVVRLEATIGKDGQIAALRLISGHPMLADAAIEAVSRWQYEPTVLNGVPAAVITEIDVDFSLKQ